MGMTDQPTPDAARDAAWISYRNSLFAGTYPYPPEVLSALKESTDLWTGPTFAAGWDARARFEAHQLAAAVAARDVAETALLECRQRIEEWRSDGTSAADMRAFLLGLQRAYGLAALPPTGGI